MNDSKDDNNDVERESSRQEMLVGSLFISTRVSWDQKILWLVSAGVLRNGDGNLVELFPQLIDH